MTPNTVTLEGYAYVEWPDLSADRFPGNQVHASTMELPSFGSLHESLHIPLITAAIARIIGAYCGTNDLLLAMAVDADADASTNALRLVWGEDQTWEEFIQQINSAITFASGTSISLPELRRSLSLSSSQSPCVALCRFDQAGSPSNSEYPAVFTYSSSSKTVEFSAPLSVFHPTISTQIVAQVNGVLNWVLQNLHTKVIFIPPLPAALSSVSERVAEEELIKAYPHIPVVFFAPDYLSFMAEKLPHVTAVQWHPELSIDSSNTTFESISYSNLDAKANQVAHWLRRHGLKQEGRVGVCLDRNLNFHAAMMGIMRAGGCYVPIDPELPLERKVYIAKDAEAAFVLTSSEIVGPDVFGSITLYIENDEAQIEISQESVATLDYMRPDNLAYLLYTSGTTGNPKGCLLTHKGLAQAILALSSTAADVRMDNIHDGRYLAVASIAFDVHLAETIVPFALGMPLISARRSQLLENLPIYVSKLGITHLGIVPSLIEATLNAAHNGDSMTLRYIASGGEKMSDSILDKWADHPQVRLANFYGPSEVTIGCCARYMSSSTPRANIGRALACVSSYVVDSDMNILPRGSVGELVVEGPLVGRGYQGRPDLTRKVFLEWPHAGCWAYRTGDLVRMMPDSTIEIMGRCDTQIKLRGVRIESEGISAIVRNAVSPSNKFSLDVTTILAKHPVINVEQLISLFSWDKSIPILTRKAKKPHVITPPPGLLKSIKEKCEIELPGYMRPSHFIPLSWLPLSSNGKTDEKLLSSLFCSLDIEVLAKISIKGDVKNNRPCTDVERKVFTILQRHITMPLNEPYPDLNVFECGLDSMGIIRFVTDLKAIFNVKLSASAVMKFPRISEITARLSRLQVSLGLSSKSLSFEKEAAAVYADPALPYHRSQIEDVLPPFPVQEGVLARSADSDSLYVQHVILSLNKSISLTQLRSAWSVIVRRHSILRTVFHFGRTLSQVLLKPQSCVLHWDDHSISVFQDHSAFAAHFLHTEATGVAKDINNSLSSIVPYRLKAYSSFSQTYLVLSIHHALFDGISLPLIFQAVEHEYVGQDSAQPVSPHDILTHISSINHDDAKLFWMNYFAGFSWTQPTLAVSHGHETRRQLLPFKTSLSSLKALAASQQVTIQAVLTSAFALSLSREIYKRGDVVFGVLRSGRLIPMDNIDNAICPLVSVVPTRVNFNSPDITLQAIQAGISSTVELEHLAPGKVQSWVRPGQSLFDVLFSLSVKNTEQYQLWDMIEIEPPEADYALSVEVVLDTAKDVIHVQAAWIAREEDDAILNSLNELEHTALGLADDTRLQIMRSLAELPILSHHISNRESLHITPTEEDSIFDADPELLDRLKCIIAEFLQIHPAVLTPSISFISMGLDSIKSVGLAKTIARLGYRVTSSDILRNATLHQISAFIYSRCAQAEATETLDTFENSVVALDQVTATEIRTDNVKLTDDDEVELFPTTALQAGMLSQTINSGGRLYLHSFPLQLVSKVDSGQLRAAWSLAIDKFAILRTSFHFSTDSGVWVQATHSQANLDWNEHSVKSIEEYHEALRQFLDSIKLDNETSFKRPPFWVRLYNHGVTGSSLVVVMHHALYDGTSVGLLFNAVEAFYQSRSCQCETQFYEILPHILVQQRDGVAFWKQQLAELKPRRLPRMHFETSASSKVLERRVSLDRSRIKDIISKASVTMQCIAQAAWAKVIGKHTDSPDIVFGHTVSGRSILGSEEVIGPVLNTIPCCVRLELDLDNLALLRIVHQNNIYALPYQQVSVRDIQKAMRADVLWDSLFLYQSATDEMSSNESPMLWTYDMTSGDQDAKIQYPLNIEVFHHDGSIVIKCASDPNFVDDKHLAQIATDFIDFLTNIVNQPNDIAFPFPGILARCRSPVNVPPNFIEDGRVQSNRAHQRTVVTPTNIDHATYTSILASVTNAPLSLLRPETHLVTLGVDSITAIQISGKFRQAGFLIAARDVVNSITIAQMVSKIKIVNTSRKGMASVASRSCELPSEEMDVISVQLGAAPGDIENICFTSSGMQWLIGMWAKSECTRYQHVFPFQLPKDIDKARLKASWFALLDHHPILRSTFVCPTGHSQPCIVTFSKSFESWSEESVLSGHVSTSLLERMKSIVSKATPTSRPQARALLYHSSEESYLILHFHHFQYDAWSLRLLMNDLSSLYTSKPAVASGDMMPFLMLYSSPNHHQLNEQQKYWKNSFPSDFIPSFFPVLKSQSNAQTPLKRLLRTNISSIHNAARLESVARSLNLSLQAVFIASWARVQAQISKATSSTFGLWQSGRTGEIDGIEDLAIPCMNVLPMHVARVLDMPALELVACILNDLHRRTSVVEQSNLVHVNEWVGGSNNPICNVFLNVVKVANDISNTDNILEPVDVPFYVPTQVSGADRSIAAALDITSMLKEDLCIDIAVMENTDTVMMSVDCTADLMDEVQADDLMFRWSEDVQYVLGLL